ncbi:MAG TPA: hypothetical protein DIC60_05990 [Lachnospiraceae bacterium]|nr:hypothetical protein [Lachnospiraceae bacterium]
MEQQTNLTISELIVATRTLVTKLGYVKETMRHHRSVWSKLEKYCEEQGIQYFSVETGLTFLKDYYHIDRYDTELTSHLSYVRRSILMLIDYYLHGSIYKSHPIKPHEFPKEFETVINRFMTEHVNRYLASRSSRQYRLTMERFSNFLVNRGIKSPSQISVIEIEGFVKTHAEYARATIKNELYKLRTFLDFIYKNGYTAQNFSSAVPKIKTYTKSKIPATFTEDELSRILSVIDYSNPLGKRDYAMIILAVKYGIRSCDIKNLKLSDLNWNENKISFTQTKTGIGVSFEIFKDVGWALIDYLKNGRPKTSSTNIFVCHCAPYEPFSEASGLARTVNKYFREAKVFYREDQVKGFHSLRPSLASNLLENNVPLHDIANILGHASVASAKVYAKVDTKHLSDCALEVSDYE